MLFRSELITNALKHGRRDDGSCDVHIDVARDGDQLVVSVRDEGRGMPSTALSSATLGMQLVRSLARQLRGKVTTDNAPGARVTLRVPLSANTSPSSSLPSGSSPTTAPTLAGVP